MPEYIYNWSTQNHDYTLALWFIRYGEYGRRHCGYRLLQDSKILFEGDDYSHARKEEVGVEAAEGLMAFLTLKPGDTDDDYFKDYTPEQLAYCVEDAEWLDSEVTQWYENMTGEERG